MLSIFSGGQLIDQDHPGRGGQTVEKLVQEGFPVVVPAQDENVVGFLDDFQASLPTKLPFNENGGHGGGDQGKTEQSPDHHHHAHQPPPQRLGDDVAIPHRGDGDHGPPETFPEALQRTGPLGGFGHEKPEAPQENEKDDEGCQGKHPLPLQGADDIDQGFSTAQPVRGAAPVFPGGGSPSSSPSFLATVAALALDGPGRLPQFSSGQVAALALAVKSVLRRR